MRSSVLAPGSGIHAHAHKPWLSQTISSHFHVADWRHFCPSLRLFFQITHVTQPQGNAYKGLEYPDGLKLIPVPQTFISHQRNRLTALWVLCQDWKSLKMITNHTSVLSHGNCFCSNCSGLTTNKHTTQTTKKSHATVSIKCSQWCCASNVLSLLCNGMLITYEKPWM